MSPLMVAMLLLLLLHYETRSSQSGTVQSTDCRHAQTIYPMSPLIVDNQHQGHRKLVLNESLTGCVVDTLSAAL